MKKGIVFLLLIITAYPALAQFELGTKGGVNFHNINIRDIDDKFKSFENSGTPAGFHLGFYCRVKLPGLFIQPDLLYTFQNSDFSYERKDGGGVEKVNLQVSKLDVPVLVGVKLGPLLIGAGPVASFTISSPTDAFKRSLKDASFGYQLGAGLNLGKKLRLEARYEGSLGKMAESVMIKGDQYKTDLRMSQFLISLGYNFL